MSQSPKVTVFHQREDACRAVAAQIAELIKSRQALGSPAVLGLATGNTPIPLYQELIRLHREDGLSFSEVITFNLDEYLGLQREHPQSYWTFMHRQLFDHVDVPSAQIHIPSGVVDNVPSHCADYEASIREAGGIDFQILGIGRTGHIGFNEPGSPANSITRQITLDPVTRQDAAPAFGGLEHVPTSAITMGCGTILAARQIALLAFGEAKASIVNEAIEGPVTDQISASFLQNHPDATFFLDEAAAGR